MHSMNIIYHLDTRMSGYQAFTLEHIAKPVPSQTFTVRWLVLPLNVSSNDAKEASTL